MSDSQQELQQKYMQIQMLEQQMVQVNKQLQMIDKQVLELNNVGEALEEIKNTKPGTELLVPLSSGIFIKAALVESDSVQVNVGSDVVTSKTFDEAKTLITSQISEIIKVKEQLSKDLEQLGVHTSALQASFAKH